MKRIALIWPKIQGDFPKIVVDGEVAVYSVEPFAERDRVYRMGPAINYVSRKVFDLMIEGYVTSFDVLPRKMAPGKKGWAPLRSRRSLRR